MTTPARPDTRLSASRLESSVNDSFQISASTKTETVVESMFSHWQDEHLLLELVSDPKTHRWTVNVLDRDQARRWRRRLDLDQVLTLLSCRPRSGDGSGPDRPGGWRSL